MIIAPALGGKKNFGSDREPIRVTARKRGRIPTQRKGGSNPFRGQGLSARRGGVKKKKSKNALRVRKEGLQEEEKRENRGGKKLGRGREPDQGRKDRAWKGKGGQKLSATYAKATVSPKMQRKASEKRVGHTLETARKRRERK